MYAFEHSLVHSDPLVIFLWQFHLLALYCVIGTLAGVLDWRYHLDPLKLKISKKERETEAKALGLGGVPILFLMMAATVSTKPTWFLVPIIAVLTYTVVAICYDEFVFHINRCGKTETSFTVCWCLGTGNK